MKSELQTCLPTYKISLSRPSNHLSLIRESHSQTGHAAKLPKFSSGTVAGLCWRLTSVRAGLGRGRGLDDDVRLHVVPDTPLLLIAVGTVREVTWIGD